MTGKNEPAKTLVVGAGPAGMLAAYLLARRGVPVTLLEANADFERDFRGDTLHPSIMEALDDLGLAEKLLQLRHAKVREAVLKTEDGSHRIADFRRLKSKFPFITLIPQHDFLKFMAEEAAKFPAFRLEMKANARELLEEEGVVRGVRTKNREYRADLVIASDGRSSLLRAGSGLKVRQQSPPMDVLWFKLPLSGEESSEEAITFYAGRGRILVVFNRLDYRQVGYIIPSGTFRELRAGGLENLRREIGRLAPEFADQVDALNDWKQFSYLMVESNRLEKWSRPGLLFIGDAAHAMTPVGGVGINLAVQDALETANILAEPLLAGNYSWKHLRLVEKRRALPAILTQRIQGMIQNEILKKALRSPGPFRPPLTARLLMKTPGLRMLPVWFIGRGFRSVRPLLPEERGG